MDAIDAAQEATDINTADALAAHKARQRERERQERIAESFRPCIPDSERRCNGCHRKIGVRRLKLQPRTGLCTRCATEAEKTFRRDFPL